MVLPIVPFLTYLSIYPFASRCAIELSGVAVGASFCGQEKVMDQQTAAYFCLSSPEIESLSRVWATPGKHRTKFIHPMTLI
jgi:hypothetical protein